MDRPATILSASIGVVLIVVSILLFVYVGGGTSTRYDIAWSERQVAVREQAFAASEQTITLPTPSAMISNLTVSSTCNDTPGTPARPATVTWALKEGSTTLASGANVPCAAFTQRVPIEGHPDVGSAKAGSTGGAEAIAYAAGDNETHTYTLVFTYSRAGGNVPPQLQVVPPAISGGMKFAADAWFATANEPAEVGR